MIGETHVIRLRFGGRDDFATVMMCSADVTGSSAKRVIQRLGMYMRQVSTEQSRSRGEACVSN